MNDNLIRSWEKLSILIDRSNHILLSTHINPDGDGLGSEVAFYHYLKNKDKDCRIINISSTPDTYTCIDPDNIIEPYNDKMNSWLNNVDLTILFDIGDYKRIKAIYPQIKGSKIILFDHHPLQDEHPYYLTILDVGAPATGYMVWKYFQYINEADFILDLPTCNALYAALICDTGSFRYGSTHSDSHLMAAHMLKTGVKPYEIHRSIFEQRKLSQIRLMSYVIQGLNFSHNGKIAWFIIDENLLKKADADFTDVDGFTEFIRTIKGVEVAYMVQSLGNQNHRINFRSSGNFIINDVAKFFGGGGHIYAAGASVKNMSTKKIVNTINKQLNEIINNVN